MSVTRRMLLKHRHNWASCEAAYLCVKRGTHGAKRKFDLAAAKKRRSNQAACKSSTAGIRSNNWACTPDF